MQIDDAIEKVEFKYTAPAGDDEAKVRAFLADHPSEQRKVSFYDTRALTVSGRGIVLRVRGQETTVKLRPAGPAVAIAAKATDDEIKLELDVVADKAVWSAKLDDDAVDDAANPFTAAQRDLLDRYTAGVPWKELEALGPIASTVWEIEDVLADGFKLEAERWTVDHLDFVELSVKARRGKADEARAAFHAFLAGLVGDTDGDRSRKTERVLRWLAG
jgi:hypothetical protein